MTPKNDLSTLLRSEVPSPGPGYWERIDAGTQQVDLDNSDPEPDTDFELHRPDNGQSAPQDNRGRFRTLLAAAAAVLAFVGGATIYNRNQPVNIDAATPIGSSADMAGQGSDRELAVDDLGLDSTDGGEDEAVESGSVWANEGSDPIRGLLGLDSVEVDSPVTYTLLASGEQAELDQRTWLEMLEVGGQPTTWVPADLLEKIADPLPRTEPSVLEVQGDQPVEVRRLPGLSAEVVGEVSPGERLSSTGYRAAADNADWVLIDAKIPFWVSEESIFPVGEGPLDNPLDN